MSRHTPTITALVRDMGRLLEYRKQTHQPVAAPIYLTPEQYTLFRHKYPAATAFFHGAPVRCHG